MFVKRESNPNFGHVKRLPGKRTKKETSIPDTKGHGEEPKGRIGGWSTAGSGCRSRKPHRGVQWGVGFARPNLRREPDKGHRWSNKRVKKAAAQCEPQER
jgi:hypothetical protein